ncbi:MAG: hypothetical protein ACLP50_17145 [Solirubrobacteraceae bacterium]
MIALAVLLVVFFGLVEGVRAIGGLGDEPAATSATTGANLSLGVFPDSMVCHGSGGGPHPEWVTYCPSTSLKVPAYSTITVTIRQYDSSTALHNYYFSQVSGTVGGVMYVNGTPVTRINPDAAGHTFTVQTPPGVKYQMFVNVPLPGVSATAPNAVEVNGNPYPKPNVIVFRFRTGAPGDYVWKCYVPCGTGLAGDGLYGQDGFGGPMATTGYMAGTLTVT